MVSFGPSSVNFQAARPDDWPDPASAPMSAPVSAPCMGPLYGPLVWAPAFLTFARLSSMVVGVKRYVVAGGSGFIGTELCRALVERGDEVTVLTRNANAARRRSRLPSEVE